MFKSGVILGLGLLTAAVPAAAEENRVISRTISYADLDLSTSAGLYRLDRRVRAAIAEMCGHADQFDLTAQISRRRCRTRAWEDYSATRPSLASVQARIRGQFEVAAR